MDANLSPLIETAKQLALLAETLERRSAVASAQHEQASQALNRTVTAVRSDVDRLLQAAGSQVSQAARQSVDAAMGESVGRFDQTATAASKKVQTAVAMLDDGIDRARATISRQIRLGYFAILGAMLLLIAGGGVVLWMEWQAYGDARARTASANVSAETAAAFAQVGMTSCGGRPCVRLDLRAPRWGEKGQYVLVDVKHLATE